MTVTDVSEPIAPSGTRVALAAAYRLAAYYGWGNLIYNHISLRSGDRPDHFFFKPHHLMFSEVHASDIVTIPLGGRPLNEKDGVNAAGYTIHSSILQARPDINCVIHTHTTAGIAMSAHGGELLPINQGAMRFYRRLSYHDYLGFADGPDECAALVRDLGPKNKAIMMRNHGLVTCGRSVVEAVALMRYLTLSCEIQLMLEATGAPLIVPSDEICEATARNWELQSAMNEQLDWSAYLRLIDAIDTSYRL